MVPTPHVMPSAIVKMDTWVLCVIRYDENVARSPASRSLARLFLVGDAFAGLHQVMAEGHRDVARFRIEEGGKTAKGAARERDRPR